MSVLTPKQKRALELAREREDVRTSGARGAPSVPAPSAPSDRVASPKLLGHTAILEPTERGLWRCIEIAVYDDSTWAVVRTGGEAYRPYAESQFADALHRQSLERGKPRRSA